jgi:hypothetical protein
MPGMGVPLKIKIPNPNENAPSLEFGICYLRYKKVYFFTGAFSLTSFPL